MQSTVKETGLTPEEAAAIIGCSAYTVKEWARKDKIPSYRVGNRIRFRRVDLVHWIDLEIRRQGRKLKSIRLP